MRTFSPTPLLLPSRILRCRRSPKSGVPRRLVGPGRSLGRRRMSGWPSREITPRQCFRTRSHGQKLRQESAAPDPPERHGIERNHPFPPPPDPTLGILCRTPKGRCLCGSATLAVRAEVKRHACKRGGPGGVSTVAAARTRHTGFLGER